MPGVTAAEYGRTQSYCVSRKQEADRSVVHLYRWNAAVGILLAASTFAASQLKDEHAKRSARWAWFVNNKAWLGLLAALCPLVQAYLADESKRNAQTSVFLSGIPNEIALLRSSARRKGDAFDPPDAKEPLQFVLRCQGTYDGAPPVTPGAPAPAQPHPGPADAPNSAPTHDAAAHGD